MNAGKLFKEIRLAFGAAVFLLYLLIFLCNPVMAQENITNNTGADRRRTVTVEGERRQRYNDLGFGDNRYNSDTVIDEPGTSDTAEEIRNLNIGNNLNINYTDERGNIAGSLRILITLTLLSLAPFLLLMTTSFTRIIIVMHFTRTAIGTQTAPPNQVLLGLSLFLTFFIMQPTITEINVNAVQPFEAGEIGQAEFMDKAMDPLRQFMYTQTQKRDVQLFLDIAGLEPVENLDDIPNHVLIPSFAISELRTAFIIGFLIYIPFIIIDMVVASTLMSMGMMMLPPTTISMPFKILLFVLADGWNLVIGSLVKTFY